MEAEHVAEFSNLRNAVLARMKDGDYSSNSGRRLLQLVSAPSFGDLECFELCRVRRADDQLQVIHSRWDFDRDYAVFESPIERMKHPRPYHPSISVRSAVVAESVYENALRKLESVSVPLTQPDHHIGADGTTYELAIGQCFCEIRLVWWCQLPDSWKALEQPLEELDRISQSLAWKSE